MQVLSIAGAVVVLLAYAGNQLDRLGAHSYAYLLMNLFGAGVLTISAIETRQAGLILMEGAWTLVSVAGLLKTMRRQ